MAESTERFEGKTPDEIKEELSRLLKETVERDLEAAGNRDLQQWWHAAEVRGRQLMRAMQQAPHSSHDTERSQKT